MDDRPGEPGSDSPGPKIIRPIPRRPFTFNFSRPTPPEDEDEDCSPPKPQISASDLRFLAPHQNSTVPSRESSTPLSHTTSYLNLTAPPLFGIYSPSTTNPFFSKDEDDQDQSQFFADRNDVLFPDADTPIDSPAPRPGLDEKTYQLMRKRASSFSHTSHIRESGPLTTNSPRRNRWETSSQLALRAALLFVLGMGYGVLVTRLPPQHNGHPLAATYESHSDWRYLAFWGAAGVALGSLLPWFDRFWEKTTVEQQNGSPPSIGLVNGPRSRGGAITSTGEALGKGQQPGTEAPVMEKPSVSAAPQVDWVLVVRGIGAFVGIVFAIRKLAWTSTMQLSLTLALTNPILWYLIDRSKPGFLFSAAVGLAGSLAVVLMGLNPGVMPSTTTTTTTTAGGGPRPDTAAANGTAAGSGNGAVPGCTNSSQGVCAAATAAATAALWGFASQETIEASIWMLSALFCSCVCFGNIGRRLALNSSAAERGRWGGVR